MRALPHASPTQRALFSPTLLYALLLLCVTSGFFFSRRRICIALYLYSSMVNIRYYAVCALMLEVRDVRM